MNMPDDKSACIRPEETGEHILQDLEALGDIWDDLRSAVGTGRAQDHICLLQAQAQKIEEHACRVQSQVIAGLAAALASFCGELAPERPAHQTIIQTYIDVMMIAYYDRVTDPQSEAGAELCLLAARAVDRFS